MMKNITATVLLGFAFVIVLASFARFANFDTKPLVAEAKFLPIDMEIVKANSKPDLQANSKGGISISEVSKHNKRNDCYLIINNNVYDVSAYIDKHPGGVFSIVDNCGKEVTGLFARIHSNKAWDLLKAYKIGVLASDYGSPMLNSIAKAFEVANRSSKVMSVEELSDRYKLKVSYGGFVYSVEIDKNKGSILNSAKIDARKKYIKKLDEEEGFIESSFWDLDDYFEDDEYDDDKEEHEKDYESYEYDDD